MRICILSPEFLHNWGGIGTYVQQLASNLAGDFEMHVVTLDRRAVGSRKEERPPEGVRVHYLGEAKDNFISNSQFQIGLLRNFNRLDAEHHFDIVHANHAQMPDLLLRLLRRDRRVVTTVHTTIDSQRMGTVSSGLPLGSLERSEKATFLMLPVLRRLEKEYLRRSANVIFVSEFIRGLFLRDHPAPEHSRVIYNGVDEDRFRPRPREECASRFPQLAGRENIVLFSGRLIALKGLETAIKAHAMIAADEGSHLVLAGTGSIDAWRSMLERSGAPPDSYTFLGPVPYPDMPFLYPLASAFVLPSHSESCPLTLLEAMACGVPSVASAVGGVPEMARQDVDAKLFPSGDAKALADALRSLLDDGPGSARLAKNARERVLSEFSCTLMARQTGEVYREAMEMAS
ncbi:MAG: glycosyltransferase family 4 protein [Methanomassiliicoccales archaeon]|nr:glycosyltransferase family 4 protein [Methanomassiliicoccales archaeon]